MTYWRSEQKGGTNFSATLVSDLVPLGARIPERPFPYGELISRGRVDKVLENWWQCHRLGRVIVLSRKTWNMGKPVVQKRGLSLFMPILFIYHVNPYSISSSECNVLPEIIL